MEEKSKILNSKEQKYRKKYDECSNLLKMIGFIEEDEINNIYDFINEIDKEIKTDKFIQLILNQKDISESIDEYAHQDIKKDRLFHCESNNTNYIIKNGTLVIKGLMKCCKDYLRIFCDKLCSFLESEYKINILTFDNIDFTDFESIYKIIDILKDEFKNKKEFNIPENFIEVAVFFGHNTALIITQVCLALYELLGGKADVMVTSDLFIIYKDHIHIKHSINNNHVHVKYDRTN